MPRARSNYIPRKDSSFDAWAENYYAAVDAFYTNQGLDPSDLSPLKAAMGVWRDAYPANVAAQTAAEGARQAKDAARAALEQAVRPVTNFVQGYPKTTDADRATLGITVRDGSRTPAPPPATAPSVQVSGGQRLTHRLRIADTAGPARRAKPPGTLGAEVWVALVDPGSPAPTNPAALSFLTLTSRTSVLAQFKDGDGGKTAVYMLRWVSTRGEKGPWGEVVGATVAA